MGLGHGGQDRRQRRQLSELRGGMAQNKKQKREMVGKAAELGGRAFHNGINAACYDSEMNALIKSCKVGEALPFLKAWSRAWTIENLNAPVE